MVFSADTIALFEECECLATELAKINPNDELLFYSDHGDRTEEEKDEVFILFIENFFLDGAPTRNMTEKVVVLALSSYRIALIRGVLSAPEMLRIVSKAQKLTGSNEQLTGD